MAFLFWIALIVIGVVLVLVGLKVRASGGFATPAIVAGAVIGVLGLVLLLLSCYYTQDAGESKVQKSFTGALVGQTTSAGAHLKAPWVSTETFDVRNNTVTYVGDGHQGDHSGGDATGAQITFQDKEGVTGNLDLVVRYSLKPDAVLDIYKQYKSQQNFVSRVITNDVRSVSRNVPSEYGTLDVYKNRAKIGLEIQDQLQQRWQNEGIVVEEVALQEVRYSDDVKQRFDDAQSARIAVTQAQAEQEKAKVDANTEVIKQEGIAKANKALESSLTPQVLQQHYIDALNKGGTIYVVPQGSTPLVQVPAGADSAKK